MPQRERVLDLLGVLVVAYDEGLQLGNVSDIYVDKKTCSLTGIAFKKGLPGYTKNYHVDFTKIRKMGDDVVIIESKAAASALPKGVEKTSLRLLKNVRIATQGGEYVGRLADVNVAITSGNIAQIILSEDRLLDVQPKTTAMGADIIVVPSDFRPRLHKAGRRESDASKNIDAVANLIETATNKVIKAAKGTTQRVVQSTQLASGTATKGAGSATKGGSTAIPGASAAKKAASKAARATKKTVRRTKKR